MKIGICYIYAVNLYFYDFGRLKEIFSDGWEENILGAESNSNSCLSWV